MKLITILILILFLLTSLATAQVSSLNDPLVYPDLVWQDFNLDFNNQEVNEITIPQLSSSQIDENNQVTLVFQLVSGESGTGNVVVLNPLGPVFSEEITVEKNDLGESTGSVQFTLPPEPNTYIIAVKLGADLPYSAFYSWTVEPIQPIEETPISEIPPEIIIGNDDIFDPITDIPSEIPDLGKTLTRKPIPIVNKKTGISTHGYYKKNKIPSIVSNDRKTYPDPVIVEPEIIGKLELNFLQQPGVLVLIDQPSFKIGDNIITIDYQKLIETQVSSAIDTYIVVTFPFRYIRGDDLDISTDEEKKKYQCVCKEGQCDQEGTQTFYGDQSSIAYCQSFCNDKNCKWVPSQPYTSHYDSEGNAVYAIKCACEGNHPAPCPDSVEVEDEAACKEHCKPCSESGSSGETTGTATSAGEEPRPDMGEIGIVDELKSIWDWLNGKEKPIPKPDSDMQCCCGAGSTGAEIIDCSPDDLSCTSCCLSSGSSQPLAMSQCTSASFSSPEEFDDLIASGTISSDQAEIFNDLFKDNPNLILELGDLSKEEAQEITSFGYPRPIGPEDEEFKDFFSDSSGEEQPKVEPEEVEPETTPEATPEPEPEPEPPKKGKCSCSYKVGTSFTCLITFTDWQGNTDTLSLVATGINSEDPLDPPDKEDCTSDEYCLGRCGEEATKDSNKKYDRDKESCKRWAESHKNGKILSFVSVFTSLPTITSDCKLE